MQESKVFKPEGVVTTGLSWQYPHFANVCHLIHRQTRACVMPKRQLNVKVKLLTSQSIYISTQPWPWPLGSCLNNETLPYANSKQINIFKTEIFCCNLKKEKKYTFIWAGFWKYLHPHENKHTKTLQKKKKGAKATGGKITLTTKNPNQSEHKEPQHNVQPDIKRGDKGAPRQNLCFPEWRFFFSFQWLQTYFTCQNTEEKATFTKLP